MWESSKKGNQVLGMIARNFTSKKGSIIVKLFKSLVRPHLDYCSQAWRPHLQKDKDVLERVQRRASRMIEECKGMGYEERLRVLKLTTLETRRRRADLVELFKIMNGLVNVDERVYVERSRVIGTIKTRGHTGKLFKKRVETDIAKYSFGNRVVDDWNRLPNSVVSSGSVGSFKGGVDKWLRHAGGFE